MSSNNPEATKPVEVVVTFLEMHARPTNLQVIAPESGLAIVQAVPPTVSFYRYLYNTVGGNWHWYQRREMTDEALAAIVQDPKVETHVLYVQGTPAGYAELDRRQEDEIELGYFGLMPDFIGRGLGHYLLSWAIDRAWSYGPKRFWVHTCTLDHPRALPNYVRAGFSPYQTKQETAILKDVAVG